MTGRPPSVPSWVLVPCLVALRGEFNAIAPDRDRSSDGSIGDEAHASSSSDHNPDETGATPYEDADDVNEVHAIDVDKDLNESGWSMDRAAAIVIVRHRSGADDRLQNVIYRGLIYSRSWGWTAREYTGPNPHDKHAHFSARYTSAQEADTRPWGLVAADQEEGIVLDQATKDWFISLMKAQIPAGVKAALDRDDVQEKLAELMTSAVIGAWWAGVHALREDAVYQAAPATGPGTGSRQEMRAARDTFIILWRAAMEAYERGDLGTAPPPVDPPPAG